MVRMWILDEPGQRTTVPSTGEMTFFYVFLILKSHVKNHTSGAHPLQTILTLL